jgi:hypothetical protein
MATVVNITEFSKRFEILGWSINLIELIEGLGKVNIPAAAAIAYLDALIASPNGLDDQTIADCPAATATKLTIYFKGKGVEAV